MKIGVMQPYFFPYLGYFDLIQLVDRWIIFDTVQYIRHGWMNRNRILHPKSGWAYIIAPLQKHSRSALIKEVQLAPGRQWKDRIVGQLRHYASKAPFYRDTIDLVRDALAAEERSLSRFNGMLLEKVCQRLEIPFRQEYFSDMSLPLEAIEGPGDWALRISQALGASEYVNPPGGEGLFDRQAFERAGVKLTIRRFENMTYSCDDYEFVPGLSVIDVMMWNDVASIRGYLESQAAS